MQAIIFSAFSPKYYYQFVEDTHFQKKKKKAWQFHFDFGCENDFMQQYFFFSLFLKYNNEMWDQ